MLVKNMKEHCQSNNLNIEVNFMPLISAHQYYKEYDAFLLSPQMKYEKDRITKEIGGKPLLVIEHADYGLMDGPSVIQKIMAHFDDENK